MSLFKQEPIIFDVPDADIRYFPEFFDAESATAMFNELMRTIPWQQDDITVFGKRIRNRGLPLCLETMANLTPTRIDDAAAPVEFASAKNQVQDC
jgi:hypothetical protein